METQKFKKRVLNLLKTVVTLAALAYVILQLDFEKVQSVMRSADPFWLLLSFILFNISKILSSLRLNLYFKVIGIRLEETYNLMLYYIGMFYNLFLPGGISGDGYKVYHLHKKTLTPYKPLLKAVFLDRISGLIPLFFLCGILFLFSSFFELFPFLETIVIIGILAIFPFSYLLIRYMFTTFLGVFHITTLFGMGVQLLQLFSALFIVYALHLDPMSFDYLFLFLISSVLAVLPISLGGIGIRELSVMYGLQLLDSDPNSGVLFSFIFFLITALSSLAGAVLIYRNRP